MIRHVVVALLPKENHAKDDAQVIDDSVEFVEGQISRMSGYLRVAFTLALRPRKGVVVRLHSEWNRINLSEGRFLTRLYRVTADTQFNPWTQLSNNIQYDSVSGSTIA